MLYEVVSISSSLRRGYSPRGQGEPESERASGRRRMSNVHLNDVCVSVVGSQVKRRPSILVCAVYVRPASQESLKAKDLVDEERYPMFTWAVSVCP